MGIHPSDPLTGLKPGLATAAAPTAGGVMDVLNSAAGRTGRPTAAGGGTRRVVG